MQSGFPVRHSSPLASPCLASRPGPRPGILGTMTSQEEALAAIDRSPKCHTCTHPRREQIDELISSGYPSGRIREFFLSQGVKVPSAHAIGEHRRNHMAPSSDPAEITRIVLRRGSREVRTGKLKINGGTLAAFARLAREQEESRRHGASEELAARAVNHLLTVLRHYLEPGQFHAFREEAWPGLLDLVSGSLADAESPPPAPEPQRAPPPSSGPQEGAQGGEGMSGTVVPSRPWERGGVPGAVFRPPGG